MNETISAENPTAENPKKRKQMGIKKLVIIIGIIIVLNLFVNYGISTFYDAPKFEDYCKTELISRTYETPEACAEVGGRWNGNTPATTTESAPVLEKGYCDTTYQCNKDYEPVRDLYNRNVFIVLIIFGILSITLGFFLSKAEAVAMGFSFGGILSLIIGTIRYWSGIDDYLLFIVLGVALAILIWIGVKKIKD